MLAGHAQEKTELANGRRAVIEPEFTGIRGISDLITAFSLTSGMWQNGQGKPSLRKGGVEAGRIQAGLSGMVHMGARRVLPVEGERPDGGVESHQQHETQRKSSHSQARPVAAEVVSRKHAGRRLPLFGRLYRQFGSRSSPSCSGSLIIRMHLPAHAHRPRQFIRCGPDVRPESKIPNRDIHFAKIRRPNPFCNKLPPERIQCLGSMLG